MLHGSSNPMLGTAVTAWSNDRPVRVVVNPYNGNLPVQKSQVAAQAGDAGCGLASADSASRPIGGTASQGRA